MEWIKDICRYIGQAIGLSTLWVGIIGLALIVFIITLIVVAAVKAKKKKAKARSEEHTSELQSR